MAAQPTRRPTRPGNKTVASPPLAAEGVVVDEFSPFDRQHGAGTRNTTRTAFGPTVTHTAPETGYPASVVAGSGSGANDRFMYTPRPTPQTQQIFHGSGVVDSYFRAIAIGHKRLKHPDAAYVNTVDPTVEHEARVDEWLKRKLVEVQGQLGNRTGVAGMSIGASARFADVIEIVQDYTPSTARVSTDEADGIATLSFDRMGSERIEWQIANAIPASGAPSGAVATVSMNGLAAAL